MIKVFCNRCGEEIKDTNNIGYVVLNSGATLDGELTKENEFEDCHFCPDCTRLIRFYIKNEGDLADKDAAIILLETAREARDARRKAESAEAAAETDKTPSDASQQPQHHESTDTQGRVQKAAERTTGETTANCEPACGTDVDVERSTGFAGEDADAAEEKRIKGGQARYEPDRIPQAEKEETEAGTCRQGQDSGAQTRRVEE